MTAIRRDEIADRLETATADARDLLGELRSELKEARRVRRDLDQAVEDIRPRLESMVAEQMAPIVRDGMEQYGAVVRRITAQAYDDVAGEMQKMANVAMYGNAQGRGTNIFDELRSRIEEWDVHLAGGLPRALPRRGGT